ncbi:hypothetical protein E2C01_076703 [Portunus trituberculatus]|uniref:Uncharacterized protein n=1 Tax=Portunus trituberculatus TaxID=210409 RepID=A0A5B7IMQ3_PORTR|nr:hypothetical protein [Portunus trituberculatus]
MVLKGLGILINVNQCTNALFFLFQYWETFSP